MSRSTTLWGMSDGAKREVSLYFEIEMICNHLTPIIKGSSYTEECYY